MTRYEHLVLFHFNETLAPETAQTLIGTLQAFPGQIPGILALTAGMNETEETQNMQGYTLGLRVTFESREALLDYGPHPAHQAFVKQLHGLVAHVAVMDYPISEQG